MGFCDRSVGLCYVRVFRLLWVTKATFVESSNDAKSDIFVDPKGKNYPEKVVSFTIQTKINLYMFRTQFLVNKKIYF